MYIFIYDPLNNTLTNIFCIQVQSLQSELQFKEAEINEMKTKLHSSDKNKVASPLTRNRSVINITALILVYMFYDVFHSFISS